MYEIFFYNIKKFWKYLAVWSSQKTILKHLRTVGSIVYNCVNYQVFVSLIFCTWNEYRAYLKAVTRKFYMKNMPWKNSKPVAGNFLDKRSNTGVFLWIFRHFFRKSCPQTPTYCFILLVTGSRIVANMEKKSFKEVY